MLVDLSTNLHFVNFPEEVFFEIGRHLSIKDQRSFHSTNYKIRYLKILEHLEKLDRDLTKNKFYNYGYQTPLPKTYHTFIAEAKSLKNGSEERCQALRNAICSVFKGFKMVCLQNTFCWYSFFEDKSLTIQLLSNYNDEESLDWCENEEPNGKFVITIYRLLAENQLNLKKVTYIQDYENPKDEKIIKLFVSVISNNLSINQVDLFGSFWNLEHLSVIVEAINKNERIGQVSIEEGDHLTRDGLGKVYDFIYNILKNKWIFKPSTINRGHWTFNR